MKLTIETDAPLYHRLLEPSARQELERELTWLLLGRVRVVEMQAGDAVWQRNGQGWSVTVDVLPEDAYPAGATCSLAGG